MTIPLLIHSPITGKIKKMTKKEKEKRDLPFCTPLKCGAHKEDELAEMFQ